MLHENAKQRILRAIPTEHTLEWHDPVLQERLTETVELALGKQVTWFDEDRGGPDTYPKVVLQMTNEGRTVGDIGHVFTDSVYKRDHADPEIAYTKFTASPMRGEMRVTVAANRGVGDIPKRVVAEQITMNVFHELLYNAEHLESSGVQQDGSGLDYAWPVRLSQPPGTNGVVDTSGMFDEQATQSRTFPVRVEYTYFTREEVEATKAVEYRAGTQKPRQDPDEVDFTDWEVVQLVEDDEDDGDE